jgi:plasmid stability protein
MATITIKNIPDDLYDELKRRAARNRRSINSEIILLIEHAFHSHKQEPQEIERQARRLREMSADYFLTEEELDQAKNEGRP